jgi:hypothetical protein
MGELKNLIVNETANSICKSLPVVCAKFRKLFHGLDFMEFFDPKLSVATQEIKIGICKFKEYLNNLHGSDCEKDGLSLGDFLPIEYSPEAMAFVFSLL